MPAPLGASLRRDFPFFQAHPSTAYLDTGATSQRPEAVISAESAFVQRDYAAVHRGSSMATGEATWAFETAREKVAAFVGAAEREIVWAQGATDAINMVALGMADASLGLGDERFALREGDEIVVTEAEHHANLIPWQRLASKTGAVLKWASVDERGLWTLDGLREQITPRTRLIAFSHVSNVTGQIAPVTDIVELARGVGALTVLDACQSVPHLPVDVAALGVDFAAFSAHKMLGPNGIGALFGRAELLDALPPARTGGSMIQVVSMREATFLSAPNRFEAGTQPVSQAVGFAAAIDYLERFGMDAVAAHEHEIGQALVEEVARIPGVRLVGPAPGSARGALVSVIVDGVHAHDVGQFLDDRNITVRTGHHCAQPLHRALGTPSSTRASAGVYSTPDDAAAFGAALADVREFFGADR